MTEKQREPYLEPRLAEVPVPEAGEDPFTKHVAVRLYGGVASCQNIHGLHVHLVHRGYGCSPPAE